MVKISPIHFSQASKGTKSGTSANTQALDSVFNAPPEMRVPKKVNNPKPQGHLNISDGSVYIEEEETPL